MHDLPEQRLADVEGHHARRCVKEKDECKGRDAAEGQVEVEAPGQETLSVNSTPWLAPWCWCCLNQSPWWLLEYRTGC